jgi:hypothetical protein
MSGSGPEYSPPRAAVELEAAVALMRDAIDAFELDLQGLTVLTESASGHFVWTPLLAATAGARLVLALAADSRHGTAHDVAAATLTGAAGLGVGARVAVTTARDDPRLGETDVATNLGFVRPLDRGLLERLGSRAAVSLMCEPWELRPGDVDVGACRELGIPLLGTNEEDPRLKMFDYLPAIAAGLLAELDVPPAGARLVLVSSGKFAGALRTGLREAGAEPVVFPPPLRRSDRAFQRAAAAADALIVADYPGAGPVLGEAAAYTPADLAACNPGIRLAHIAGDVRREEVAAAGIRHAPATFAPPGHMSVTAARLGPVPVIDLHCAGLKVGEALVRARRRGLHGREAELAVLESLPLALGFEHDAGGSGA